MSQKQKTKKYKLDGFIITIPEEEFRDYTPTEVGFELIVALSENTIFKSVFIGKIKKVKEK